MLKNLIRTGWMPVDRNLLQERNIFYPESWEFMIKPPTVNDVRNWSVIDNEDPDQIDKVQVENIFIEIFEQCLSIYDHKLGKQIHWTEINSWDKYFWLLMIRDYTFVKGEAKLQYEEECLECDSSIFFTFNSLSLYYELPDPEVMPYWNQNTRTWIIDTAEFGVDDGGTLYLSAPTLKKDLMITQYEYECKSMGKTGKEYERFFQYLPWFLHDVPDDYAQFKQMVREQWRKTQDMSIIESIFLDQVIKNIEIPSPKKLVTRCDQCGEQMTSIIRFDIVVTIYVLFKINLRNLVKNKLQICKNYHLQPSELDRLQYWEFEYYLQDINDDVEQEKERQEQEQKQYDTSQFNPSNMKMPSMPSYGSSMPSFSMPSMPSF